MASDTNSFDTSAISHPGMLRRENQDSFARADTSLGSTGRPLRQRYGRLYVVADGVGGNDDGLVASQLVVKQLMYFYYYDPDAPATLLERLRYAIVRTSQYVHAEALKLNSNMASTVVVALLHQDTLIIANVGDSPAFLFRPNTPAKYLTIDHVMQRTDGSRPLTQSMGDIDVNVAFFSTDFRLGDVLVLCTDGLTNVVSAIEIERIVSNYAAHEAGQELIRLANKRGAPDNVTALVVRNGRSSFWQQRRFYFIAIQLLAVLCVGLLLWWLLSNRLSPTSIIASSAIPSSPASLTNAATLTALARVGGAATTVGLIADPPTSTPIPTDTPTPTNTPTPTPTNTSTPRPSNTPRPTRTSTPLLVATALITAETTLMPVEPTNSIPVTPTIEPTVPITPTSENEQQSFYAQVMRNFGESEASGQAKSCVEGQVFDRNGVGVGGARVQTNNGRGAQFDATTNEQGHYIMCGLGQSSWSVVLFFVPSQANPSLNSLKHEAIGLVYVNGSLDQIAYVNFNEK